MNKYRVMYINGGVFDNHPEIYAKNTSEAVLKAFGKNAVRSGEFVVDYCVTNLMNGRKIYLKEVGLQ